MVNQRYEKEKSRISSGSARIEQETRNKQVIGYLATLGPDHIDSTRLPELMNQAVGFIEVVMGDQVEDDYPSLIKNLKVANVLSRAVAVGLLESMNADASTIEKFFEVWDK